MAFGYMRYGRPTLATAGILVTTCSLHINANVNDCAIASSRGLELVLKWVVICNKTPLIRGMSSVLVLKTGIYRVSQKWHHLLYAS